MKRALLLIVLGILLFSSGMVLYSLKSKDVVLNNEKESLSKEEAISIVSQLINDVIKVYENPGLIFHIVEDNSEYENRIKIDNYSQVISSLFSSNGIKQLEGMTFEKETFLVKDESFVYLLSKLPFHSQYTNSKIAVNQITVTDDKISCELTFSSDSLDANGVINYYVITKNLVVIKSSGQWLVEDFNYSNG